MTTVSIPDFKPDIFHHMLYYTYGGGVPDNDLMSNAQDLIDAADKFGIVNLKLKAEACYVKSTMLTINNVLDNLCYTDSKNCAPLKEAVMDFIVDNCYDIISQISFENVPRSVVTDLLIEIGRGKKVDNVSSGTSKY